MKNIYILFFCEKEAYIPMQEIFLAEELSLLEINPIVIPVLQDDKIQSIANKINNDDKCNKVIFWQERMTVGARVYSKIISIAKKIDKKKFFGGIYSTLFVNDIVKSEKVFDFVIEGYNFPEIALKITQDKIEKIIKAYGSVDINKYQLNLDYIAYKEKFTDIMHGYYTSQGCPNSCSYCFIAQKKDDGLDYQLRKVSLVKSDLKNMKEKLGAKYISFKDPNFFARKDVYEILDYLVELGLRTKKNIDITLNDINEELISLITKKYHINELFFGLESFSQDVLDKQLNKDSTISKLHDISKWIGKYKVNLSGIMMVGFPWQTDESIINDVKNAFDLQKKVPNFKISFNPYIPIPKTKLFEKYYANSIKNYSLIEKIELFNTSYKVKRKLPYVGNFKKINPVKLRKNIKNRKIITNKVEFFENRNKLMFKLFYKILNNYENYIINNRKLYLILYNIFINTICNQFIIKIFKFIIPVAK